MRAFALLAMLLLAGCANPVAEAPDPSGASMAPPAVQRTEAAPVTEDEPEEPEERAEPPEDKEDPETQVERDPDGNASLPEPRPTGPAAHVVVAQFDTGVNPFHPCFRRPGWDASEAGIPGFPSSTALGLEFEESYEASLKASTAIQEIEEGPLYHIPGTNLLFRGTRDELVDTYPHGAMAASQVVCEEYGMAPEAWLLVLNWYEDFSGNEARLLWVAEQAWIDVVHLNIQDIPLPLTGSLTRAIAEVIASGKLVVIAAGNGVMGVGANYPMELSSYNGPSGSLIAGANDNGGYTVFSNLNPHVVMDGGGTKAAEPHGYGETGFSGTSSASPRITGYAAALLQALREETGGVRSGTDLVQAAEAPGPLSDGVLSVAELHEVVRKTADPNPHDSRYNGDRSGWWVPQPVDSPYAVYAKMGYGQVSEHTFPVALDVLLGQEPMPERMEDAFYTASEEVRERYWG